MDAVMIQLYVFLGISSITTAAVVFIFATAGLAPLGALISSKLKRSPIILLGKQDGSFELQSGTYKHGVVNTKRGCFLLSPEGTMPFHGRKMAIAYEQASNVLPKKLIEDVNLLQEQGIMDIQEAEKTKVYLERMAKKKKGGLKATDDRLLKGISNVMNYFLYSANPAQIADKEAAIIELTKKKDQKNWLLIGGGIAMAVLAFALGFYVVGNYLKCPVCPSFEAVCGVAKSVAASAGGGMVIT